MPPVVLIHGLFGWGEERPFYGLAPTYFPLQELRSLWRDGPVVAVDVGVASSDHDRAAEALAQLLGRRVDYGKEHAEEVGHERFGQDYSGKALLDVWDANHPVHIVGHSFGGNTAVALYDMIARDFWGLGTSAEWVISVTCICSPLRGCSLPFVLGLCPVEEPNGKEELRLWSTTHGIATVAGLIWKASLHCPLVFRPLYNLRIDQWREHCTLRSILTATHPYWTSSDNMISEITPRYRRKVLRNRFGNLSQTYVIAVVAGALEPMSPSAFLGSLAGAASIPGLLAFVAWRLARRWLGRKRAADRLRQLMRAALLSVAGLLAALLGSAEVARHSPAVFRGRAALAARLQAALRPARPFLYGWLGRPFLQLCSFAVKRAHDSLPEGSALVASGGATGGENDGLIDLMSQRGLDAPTVRPAGRVSIRGVRSSGQLCGVKETALNRAFSQAHMADNFQHEGGQAKEQLHRGKWHVINVPGADHFLGTWMDPYLTTAMYKEVFQLLERCGKQQHHNRVV